VFLVSFFSLQTRKTKLSSVAREAKDYSNRDYLEG
jgi:hypothetical protein